MSNTDDRLALHDLQVRYSLALDTLQLEWLDDVFTADVVGDYQGMGELNGVQAIKDVVQGALGPLDAVQHLNGNHWADIDGDTAVGGCYFRAHMYRAGVTGGEHFTIVGEYHDRFVRTAAGWRIAHRTLTAHSTMGNPAVRYADR